VNLVICEPLIKRNRLKLNNYGSGYNGDPWIDNPGYLSEQLSYDIMGNILTYREIILSG